MNVARLHIRNFLGIEELEVRPGAITVAEGGNGAGKTSFIEAVKSLAAGGAHDATVIRQGAEEAEVVLELDDGTVFEKHVTAAGSTFRAEHPTLGRVAKPVGYLQSLIDGFAMNPVAFLTADPKTRAAMVLDTVPLAVTEKELREAIGDAFPVPPMEAPAHALKVIDKLARTIYDDRTGVNRLAKEARTTAEQLRASLPPDWPTDPREIETAIGERQAAQAELEDEFRSRRARAEEERDAAHREIAARRDARVAELLDQVQQVKEEAHHALRAEEEKKDDAVAAAREEIAPQVVQLREEVSALGERLKAAEQVGNTRRLIEVNTERAETHEEKAQQLTRALEGLETLKARLASKLPAGLELRDGQLYLKGVPFERANNAARVQAAINLAAMRAQGRQVKLVPVDGLECLDADTFRRFEEKAAKAGLQLIVTRVSDGPLTVRTVEEPAA